MIRSRRQPRLAFRVRNRKRLYLFRFLSVLLILLILLLVLDARLRPVIRDYSYSRAVYLATSTINDAGIDLLSGIGPIIHIEVVPLGQATAAFGSEFTSAGINQTRHSITMQVSATVTIILPRESIETEVTTHVDVAETVIVGVVPDSYTNVEDATGGDMTEKIFNYVE